MPSSFFESAMERWLEVVRQVEMKKSKAWNADRKDAASPRYGVHIYVVLPMHCFASSPSGVGAVAAAGNAKVGLSRHTLFRKSKRWR